jgi:hypothetical protein
MTDRDEMDKLIGAAALARRAMVGVERAEGNAERAKADVLIQRSAIVRIARLDDQPPEMVDEAIDISIQALINARARHQRNADRARVRADKARMATATVEKMLDDVRIRAYNEGRRDASGAAVNGN